MLVGGSSARYADSISGTAGLVSIRLAGYSPLAAGVVEGTFSKFVSGEWITQVSGYGTIMGDLGRGVSLGVAGGGNANYTSGSPWVGELSAGPLIAYTSGGFLSSVGVALGGARDIDDSTFGTAITNARLRYTFRGGWYLAAGGVGVAADTNRYADLTLETGLLNWRIRIALLGGIRTGDLADDPWAQARLEYAVTPRAVIEMAAGRYPRDMVGFSDGMFVTLGARFGLTNAARRVELAPPPVAVERFDDGRVRVSFGLTDPAERLEIAGDWNGWDPIPLRQSNAKRWFVELRLDPGIHRYSLIVNGDTWVVPPGVPTQPDDFGGEVALLVVEKSR